jgi:tetratricopeptide (TPR) repeat protein
MLFRAGRREDAMAQTRELERESEASLAHVLELAYVLRDFGEADYALTLAIELATRDWMTDIEGDALSIAIEMSYGRNIAHSAHLLAARIYLACNLLEPAFRHANRVLELDPESRDALLLVARIALLRGHTGAAQTSLGFALQDDPSDAEAHYLMGRTLLQEDKARQGLEHLAKACALAPDSGLYQLARGNALLALGDLPEAKVAYAKAAEMLPDTREVHTRLGIVAEKEGDFDAAYHHYGKAISQDPGNAVLASANMADLMLEQNLESALLAPLAYSAYAQAPPGFRGKAADTLARVLIRSGSPSAALAPARIAAAADPQNAGRLLRVGVAEQAAGYLKEAKAALEKAVELGKDTEVGPLASKLIEEISEQETP